MPRTHANKQSPAFLDFKALADDINELDLATDALGDFAPIVESNHQYSAG